MNDEERTPPEKIRVTGLQEAFLLDLVRFEQQSAELHWQVGLTAEQIQPRDEVALAMMTRGHDVLVAEADHCAAGYLAWADEAPGVACLKTLCVGREYLRFGIGTRLMRELGAQAAKYNLEHVVGVCWDAATWAQAFLTRLGFSAQGSVELPEKLKSWQSLREEDLAQPGQRIWWRHTKDLGTIPGLPIPEPY